MSVVRLACSPRQRRLAAEAHRATTAAAARATSPAVVPSYASILYLRLPPNFRIILRGADVRHHSLVNDMMLSQKITYKPSNVADSVPNNSNMVAGVTIGFVKDASYHISRFQCLP